MFACFSLLGIFADGLYALSLYVAVGGIKENSKMASVDGFNLAWRTFIGRLFLLPNAIIMR